MLREPVQNDPNNPLVSILVFNYEKQYLTRCLDSILHQEALKNFEIIFIDDASADGSWDTAVEYSHNYPGLMTIRRNRAAFGPKTNLYHCVLMAKGGYCTILMNDQAFLPEYIEHCVKTMASDPYAQFNLAFRIEDPPTLPLPLPFPLPSVTGKPLVSILCYNYNYGRYLRECLESVFAQTYENIELCFSDNASTDESWDVALEFARKYPTKMYMTRNRKNFGPDDNFANCRAVMRGKYFINFCSDDALAPEYVERCVSALEGHPDTGLAIVNRTIIDEQGRRTEEPPFYNQSCVILGEEQAAVYMMAGINPSVSQIMYRNAVVNSRSSTGSLAARYYGTRILDFNISTDFNIVYIKEPLLMHRIHGQSDTSQADASLMPVIGLYVLNHQFADIASVRRLTKVVDRLPSSIDKLAGLAVRYSVRYLLAGDEQTALRYFHLAMAMTPRVGADPTRRKLEEYWAGDQSIKAGILDELKKSSNLVARSISYDPPPGSVPIETNP
jgi:glycosyltransferase involved in cell wall biosynthesis